MAKAKQQFREKTLGDNDALAFEKWLPWGIALVVAMVFIISFNGLVWVGRLMNMHPIVAFIVPLAIDGFQLACTAALMLRTMNGHKRSWPEWIGLIYALGLSVIGNLYHASGDPLPFPVLMAFAAAFPLFVALGVHIYLRAKQSGLRSKILASDTDHILVDEPATGAVRAPQQSVARKEPAAVRTPTAQETVTRARTEPARAQGDAQPAAQETRTDAPATLDEARAEVRAIVREYVEQTGATPRGLAKDLHTRFGMGRWVSESQVRRYVADAREEMAVETDPLSDAPQGSRLTA